jgi:hypothetical protein
MPPRKTRIIKEARMARIELPSGNWIEYRDRLLAADRFAVQAVARVELKDSGNSASFLEMQNDMRNALLGRIITKWSYSGPVPSEDSFRPADMVIGEIMDLDDYSALEKAVEPLMDKISGRGGPDPKKQPSD